jgi:hypothetical protein
MPSIIYVGKMHFQNDWTINRATNFLAHCPAFPLVGTLYLPNQYFTTFLNKSANLHRNQISSRSYENRLCPPHFSSDRYRSVPKLDHGSIPHASRKPFARGGTTFGRGVSTRAGWSQRGCGVTRGSPFCLSPSPVKIPNVWTCWREEGPQQ